MTDAYEAWRALPDEYRERVKWMLEAEPTSHPPSRIVKGDFSNYVKARKAGMDIELVPQPEGRRGWFRYGRIEHGDDNE